MRRCLILVCAFLSACGQEDHHEPRPKVALAIMTALPLFWAEGDPQLAVSQTDQKAPFVEALEQRFDVRPIDLITPESLKPYRLLDTEHRNLPFRYRPIVHWHQRKRPILAHNFS